MSGVLFSTLVSLVSAALMKPHFRLGEEGVGQPSGGYAATAICRTGCNPARQVIPPERGISDRHRADGHHLDRVIWPGEPVAFVVESVEPLGQAWQHAWYPPDGLGTGGIGDRPEFRFLIRMWGAHDVDSSATPPSEDSSGSTRW